MIVLPRRSSRLSTSARPGGAVTSVMSQPACLGGWIGLRFFEMNSTAEERFWTRRATSLAGKVNLGWWLDRFNGLAVVSLLLFALAVLAVRTYRSEFLTAPLTAGSLAVVGLVLALLAWLLSRRHYIGLEEGLARLDDRLHLHNRLCAAYHGIGPWPGKTNYFSTAGFRWRYGHAILPTMLSLALVATAWYLPVKKSDPGAVMTPVEPGAWEQMEDWLATLEEENLIEESDIEELKSRIEELRDQPDDEWFSHSSLEATDTLAETLGRQMREMAAEMTTLDRNIAALKNFSTEMSEAGREQKLTEFVEALDALNFLKENGFAMNETRLKQLQEIDPSHLGRETISGLSPEELKALQEQLQKGATAIGSLEGLPSLGEELSLQPGSGMGLGAGAGKGMTPGQGGVERGRGDAPLFYGDKEDNLGTENIETIKNEDLSRATPGEVLGLGETEREIDKRLTGPQSGGRVNSTGQGGDAVSRETLRPDEQAVLKRYFK